MKLPCFFQRRHTALPTPLIVVAPDKFKGTLSADEVTAFISEAMTSRFPAATVRQCPMADGGEGSAQILARELNLSPAVTPGHDALMRPTDISYFTDGKTCAVDAAAIVGLAMLADVPLRPWEATTFGIGEFIAEMLRRGMHRIVVGIGGTATVDAGAGMLQALGVRFLDVDGELIDISPVTAANLSTIFTIDFSGLDRKPVKQCVTALADVDVPLLPTAADSMSALDFAAQKGLTASGRTMLHAAFQNFTAAIDKALYPPADPPRFQGAGGGLGYAMHRVLRCECTKGADHIIDSYRLFNAGAQPSQSIKGHLPQCIITGEGRFDEQSLHGKVTGSIIERANRTGTPVIVVTGSCTISPSKLPAGVKVITTGQFLPQQERFHQSLHGSDPITHADAVAALQKALPAIADAVAELLDTHFGARKKTKQ